MRERPVPALGRVSQAKRFYRLLLKPALFQIIQNVPALCKFRFVKLHGFFQQEKISPALGQKMRVLFFQNHPSSGSQKLEGLRKINPLNFVNKTENIPALGTSETVPDVTGGRDIKRRRLFVMKRAKGLKILPGLDQAHIGAHHVRRRKARFYIFHGRRHSKILLLFFFFVFFFPGKKKTKKKKRSK